MDENEPSKIVRWVIKWSGGYVKDETQATYVLIGLVVGMVLLAFVIPVFIGGNSSKPPVPSINGTYSNRL